MLALSGADIMLNVGRPLNFNKFESFQLII